MAVFSATRRPSVSIVGPPVLWSVHFLFVYVFVSLACLWGWGGGDGTAWLGVGVIEWVVALATVLFGAAIGALGVQAWRERAATPRDDVPPSRQRFVARVGALQAALFLVATVFVGLLTLPRPSCY